MAEQIAKRILFRVLNSARKDISDFTNAIRASRQRLPKFDKLQELYIDVQLDAHLVSQLSLRRSGTLSQEFELYLKDKPLDLTPELNSLLQQAVSLALDARFFGYSYVEFLPQDLSLTLLDRRNFDPVNRLLYPDLSETGIFMPKMREWGRTLLEFSSGHDGELFQTVPHVLFKRYAQSCWSEHCEIYGMPPRYIKTNTQDRELIERYEAMLSDIGSGASYILDLDDEIGFASTNATDGAVYENLIRLCSNEISLRICGGVLGQDTVNGSNAKEEAAQKLLEGLVKADKSFIEDRMNSVFLPALYSAGLVPEAARFAFLAQRDTKELFSQTMQAAAYFNIDPKWFKDNFGIEVTAAKTSQFSAAPTDNTDFFA